ARPGLLAVQDPPAVLLLRPGAKAGEVAARVGLAEALAEDELAAENLLDVLLLLPRRAVDQQRWREKGHAQPPEDDRGPGACHLLLVYGLHHGRRGAASGLLRPRQLQPAGLVQAALPLALDLLLLVFAVAADPAVAKRNRKVGLEP